MDAKEHSRHHGLEQGTTMVTLKCPWCNLIFERERRNTFLIKKKNKYTTCSPTCRGKISRHIQLHGISSDTELAIKNNFIKEYIKYN